jgi:hypothetical protein
MKTLRLALAAIVVCSVALLCAGTLREVKSEEQPMTFTATQLPIEGTLPSLGGAIEWLNTQPLNMTQLHGKVVVVEFWTYTCINWRRTLPYVRACADKYKDQGSVSRGALTPSDKRSQEFIGGIPRFGFGDCNDSLQHVGSFAAMD